MNNSIAAIILTYNEEKHISRCINSLKNICEEIFVIDSFSKDRTVEIAKEAGAQVYQNPWKNYATQFNWGLKNCPITTEWIWRIDADEFLEGNLGPAMKKALAECNNEVNGVYVRKRIDFMGKPLLHGGWYPSYHLKVWRRGHGECENRWMDEHIRIFSGTTITVEEGNQVDANLNDLTYRYNFMQAIKLEAKVEKTKTEVPILGKTGKGNKSTGWKGSGSATFHYNTSIFRELLERYKRTGEDIYFDIEVTNEDPTSSVGLQTVNLINCNIDGGILAKFDAGGEYLDEDMDFTFEDFEIPNKFNKLAGM